MHSTTILLTASSLLPRTLIRGVLQRRRFRQVFAYGTFIAVMLFASLLLWLPQKPDTNTPEFVSAVLAHGYADFDSPATANQPRTTPVLQPGLPSVPVLIAQLENRLATEPGDARGWSLLAQSYAYVGNQSGVESAIAAAVRLGENETALRSRVAVVNNSENSWNRQL